MRLDEFLASALAARKMGLTQDPHGAKLPDDLWRQCLADALFLVDALIAFDHRQTVSRFYEADEEDG